MSIRSAFSLKSDMSNISKLRRSLLVFSVVGAGGFVTGVFLLVQSKDAFFTVVSGVLTAGGLGVFVWTVKAPLKLEEAAGEAGVD